MTVTEDRLRAALTARAELVPQLVTHTAPIDVHRGPATVRRPLLVGAVAAATVGAIALAFSLAGASSRAEPAGRQQFQRMSDSPLAPRSGHSAAWTGSQLFIWGGESTVGSAIATAASESNPHSVSPFLNDGALYDPATDEWRRIGKSPLTGRRGAAAASIGSDVYVMGGDAGGNAFSDAAKFNTSNDSWTPIADPPQQMCVDHVVAAGSLVFAVGEPRCHRVTFDLAADVVARYDTKTNEWSMLPDPVLFGVQQLVEWNGAVVALDARGHAAYYDSVRNKWVSMPDVPDVGPPDGPVGDSVIGKQLALGSVGGLLVAAGSFQTSTRQGVKVYRWNVGENTWSAPIEVKTAGVSEPPVAVATGTTLVWTSDSAGLAWYDGTSTSHFVTTPQVGTAVMRRGGSLTAVSRNRVVYWGGQVDNRPSNDGLIMNVSTAATSPDGAQISVPHSLGRTAVEISAKGLSGWQEPGPPERVFATDPLPFPDGSARLLHWVPSLNVNCFGWETQGTVHGTSCSSVETNAASRRLASATFGSDVSLDATQDAYSLIVMVPRDATRIVGQLRDGRSVEAAIFATAADVDSVVPAEMLWSAAKGRFLSAGDPSCLMSFRAERADGSVVPASRPPVCP